MPETYLSSSYIPGNYRREMSQNARSRARFQDPLKLVPRALRKLHTEWLRMTYPFVSMGSKVSIHYTCSIDRKNAHRIKLGNRISIEKDTYLGINVSPEEEGEPVIVIDDNCVIHWRSQIGAKILSTWSAMYSSHRTS